MEVVDYSALAEALKADGVVEAPKAEVKEPEKVEVTEKPAVTEKTEAKAEPVKEEIPKTGHESIDKSFAKLSARSQELRAREQRVQALEGITQAFGNEGRLQAIAKAVQDGNPLSLLAAAGFNYQQLVEQLKSGEAPKAETPKTPDELAALKEELHAIKQTLSTSKMQSQRAQVMQEIPALVPAECKLVKGMEEYGRVLDVLEDYYRKNGELPAETREESIAMAARFVEADLTKSAEKWKKALTVGQTMPTLAKSGTETPAAVRESVSAPLSNRDSAPSRALPSFDAEPDYKAIAAEAAKLSAG